MPTNIVPSDHMTSSVSFMINGLVWITILLQDKKERLFIYRGNLILYLQ